MRNTTLAAFISSALLVAAAAQAQPAPADATSAMGTEQSTTTSTDSSATTTPSTSSTATTPTSDYDASTSSSQSGNASDSAMTGESRWKAADTDKSGTLSVSEMQAAMPSAAKNFSQMDKNSDGQVSRDEMRNYKTEHGAADMQKSFAAADVNGDKMIDKSEAASMPMLSENFTTLDTNKDGKVSMEEMRAHHHSMDKEMGSSGKTSAEADEQRSTTTTTHSTTETTTDKDATAPADSSTTSQ